MELLINRSKQHDLQYITTTDTNRYPMRMHILEEFETQKAEHKGKVKSAKYAK
jgi:hypothetical protein